MNRRDALKQFAAISAALPFANIAWAKEPFEVLDPAQKTDDPSKIEILEFFHYGCPHCRDFEPLVEAWRKKQPDDVSFRQVPAIWNNPQLSALARLFYAAEVSGELPAVHQKAFIAIQEEKRQLFDETQVRDWIADKVSDSAKFMAAYTSFGVNSMLQRADQLARAMRIQGVPTVVVDGRFLTSASMAGSHEEALKVLDQLIVRVRKERGGK